MNKVMRLNELYENYKATLQKIKMTRPERIIIRIKNDRSLRVPGNEFCGDYTLAYDPESPNELEDRE
jgi:hypothetical protein